MIVSPRRPLNSGKVQIMVVEEVNFKRVIFERVPVDKVKDVLSMPQSVTRSKLPNLESKQWLCTSTLKSVSTKLFDLIDAAKV